MKEFNTKETNSLDQESESKEGASMAPPAFSLTANPIDNPGGGGRESAVRSIQTEGVVQRQVGDNYERGNRPNPSSSNGSTYEIESSKPSIMTTGQSVNYSLRQIQTTMRASDSVIQVSWRALNGAVGPGVDAVVQGPQNSWHWNNVRASLAGVHTIQAVVTLNGNPLETVSFSQVVEAGGTGYANIAGVAPTPLANMSDLVSLVMRIEAAYPGYAWQDVATKIRKQFYPGPTNSEGSRLSAAFTWNDLIDEQEHVAPLQSPPCAAADIAALRNNAAIDGVDIGHVLTGVDSMNFPETAGIFSMTGVSGPAAATWSGDVGSALVFWANEAGLSDTTGGRREAFYTRYSSMDDLLGDIDGINIAQMPSLGPNAPLSARLRAYYQTSSSESRNQRYHRFCQISGFTVVGNRVDASARPYIRDQVERFTRAYNTDKGALGDAFLMSGGGMGSMGGGMMIPPVGTHELTTGHQIAENLDWFVDRFIRDLNAGLAAE